MGSCIQFLLKIDFNFTRLGFQCCEYNRYTYVVGRKWNLIFPAHCSSCQVVTENL